MRSGEVDEAGKKEDDCHPRYYSLFLLSRFIVRYQFDTTIHRERTADGCRPSVVSSLPSVLFSNATKCIFLKTQLYSCFFEENQ